MVNSENSNSFFAAFQRPAWIVMMVAQMLLGLALFLTLILKFYMLVVGVDGCLEGSTSTGNLIRCTGTLEIVANFIFAMAGFRFAEFMFQERPRAMLGPLMVAVSGVFVMLMSGLTYQVATWSVAATILTLMLAISAIIAAQVYLRSNNHRS
ncbi:MULTISPECIES: hypothetical protein [unclassified Falsihalocynthiibacter]|uniref:hypothetical protein n=1 Tax=unclassified Falsihalocynthiibacter TaxID=2854191 RepID=UPI0035103C49